MSLTRQFWVIVHRWAGLTLTLFLVTAGVTGALLPFNEELADATARWRQVAPPSPDAQLLDPMQLREMAQARVPDAFISMATFETRLGHATVLPVSTAAGKRPPDFDEIALDPYTGREVYRGTGGDLTEGWHQIMPFLYRLHYSFALGNVGIWAFGIAALVWTLDCFVGFYLTLPLTRRDWWARWRRAWTIRRPVRSPYKFNLDVHLVSGLWLWPLLLVFAWSSVSFNLYSVYRPVMGTIAGMVDETTPPRAPATHPAVLDWREALRAARAAASEAGNARGVTIERERALYFDPATNVYDYVVRTSRDKSDRFANSWFSIDGDTGQLLRVQLPTGEHAGNTISYWLGLLHLAGVFGMPYRIFVSFFGLVVVALSVTGVVIWMKKRSARVWRSFREQTRRAGAAVLSGNGQKV